MALARLDEVRDRHSAVHGGEDVDVELVRATRSEDLAVEPRSRPLTGDTGAAPEVVDGQILEVVIGDDVDAAVQEERRRR